VKRLIVALTVLSFLASCVGPRGPSQGQAPHPQPVSAKNTRLMRVPPECDLCNADMRRRLGDCGSSNSSCMARCTGDAMQIAMCQSNCVNQYSSCAAYASVPNGCPAYCAL
jgi:hypothetical protein